MRYPRTKKDLKKIYDRRYAQPGDTDKDFYEWAIGYLLDELQNLLNKPMNAHGETLETILTARGES